MPLPFITISLCPLLLVEEMSAKHFDPVDTVGEASLLSHTHVHPIERRGISPFSTDKRKGGLTPPVTCSK
jgi:hypothetical protein